MFAERISIVCNEVLMAHGVSVAVVVAAAAVAFALH